MVSLETAQPAANRSTAMDQTVSSSPRISFSAEFLDDSNFISISPNHHHPRPNNESENQKPPLSPSPIRTTAAAAADLQFEFLSNSGPTAGHAKMLTADELFFEGKLLPFWQMQQSDRLNKISLKCHEDANPAAARPGKDDAPPTPTATRAVNWFVDDDPSPRPPKCTVLWKELLRLKKQRPASSLSPSSSSSSTSSSSSSLADAAVAAAEEKKKGEKESKSSRRDSNSNKTSSKEGSNTNNNQVKRAAKKGLERTRSASIRIRPMINVPICSQMKSSTTTHSSALPPFFPLKKNRVVER